MVMGKKEAERWVQYSHPQGNYETIPPYLTASHTLSAPPTRSERVGKKGGEGERGGIDY